MFKWPGSPSAQPVVNEFTDFLELMCWQRGRVSVTEASAFLGRLGENDYSDGVPEEDYTDPFVREAFQEVDHRREACSGGYPFSTGEHGYTLASSQVGQDSRGIVYKFLLLAARLKMNENRVHAGIDGTQLFEELSAEVAREYLGDRAESVVFGTATGSSDFPGKVDDLCRRIGEGICFLNRDEAAPTANDGKLDVVVWKQFSDGLPGKIIGFGQCKTGTAWKGSLAQLQPDSFCHKWLHSSPVVTPVRMFFVSEAISRVHWHSMCSDAGLVLDRCRIIDYCKGVDSGILAQVQKWSEGAAQATGLPV